MRLAHLYLGSVKKEKSTKGFGFLRTFLFAGILMVFMPFVSSAIFIPDFNTASPQNRTICGNLPTDISNWLRVTDLDAGETLTWTVLVDPSNGVLSGFPATAPAGGSVSTPVGLIYTPNTGATSDAFTVMVDDGMGGTDIMVVTLTINAGPELTLGSFPSVCRGVTNAVIPFTGLTNVGPDTVILNYTGAMQSWTVPANVTAVRFDAMGASGGNDNYSGAANPGKGGRIQGTMSVFPGNTLNVFVGGRGNDGTPFGATGGFNGGGNAFSYFFVGCGGAGGGATDIRLGGTGLANRKVVAGGGGGNGADNNPGITPFFGGAGGGLTGGNSENNIPGSNSKGGTQTTGGAPATYAGWTPGAFGMSGVGGNGSTEGVSGAGGGGYFGGGGGVWTGGGGGSNYADGISTFSVTHTRGANEGDGLVRLYYTNPGTYTIIWDNVAETVGGFENVADALLPTNSEFNIAVPAGAPADTYHGTLTINNVNCNSVSYPIEVTVKPLPTVEPIEDQILCHGEMTADITPSGPISGGSYTWVNSNPAIGLPASGEGHIAAFFPINETDLPVSADITVTPVANGCIGTSIVFHIVDNPIPELNSTLTPASVCNNALFSYLPNSLTPGTSFDWVRATTTGIANPASSGAGNPNENLLNLSLDPVTVTYSYTLAANSCVNTQNVTVVVNPTPQLSSTLTPPALCNNEVFNYTPVSSTTGATLTWHRPVVAGISNAAASGSGSISETLINTSTTPRVVTYVITLTIDGCSYTEEVVVTVNPALTLSSTMALTPTCDSQLLNYIPTTSISGAALTWSRASVAGISNPAATGTGNISESLVNTTPAPIVVTYVYTVAAFGCTNTQNVTITVNPRPRLSSTLTPAGICTNTLFAYTPSSATAGASFVWARDTVVGIANPTAIGTGGISELVINNTDLPIDVPYLYTIFANGCADSQVVLLTVNPMPRLSNDISALAVCDSAVFNFTPTSITPSATFAWSRGYEAGISNINATGTGNPAERLNNTTYITVPVTYIYTISAKGCTNTQGVTVQVRPSAILTSNTAVTCSGAEFVYEPVSYTTLATFAWSRTASPGITPPSKSGTGNILDTLTQGTSGKVTVVYDFDLTVFGCVNKQKVNVTVNPAPTAVVIGTHPSADICSNATAVNFGAANAPVEGYSYSWSATNANLIASGGNKQFALVTFAAPGTATVTLTTRINETTCTSTNSFVVNVGSGVAVTPEVIYFDGQFICKETDLSTYQWGYDDIATLDSAIIPGETNQNYANQYPEFDKKYYWVMTTRNGCTQKTYYNKPAGVADVNIAVASIKLYPNPASNFVNVEVSNLLTGNIRFDVYNMLGQKLQQVTANNNKAQISIADLAAGAYIVDCYSDGVKVAAARFIKN